MKSSPMHSVAEPQAILRAWTPFKRLLGVTVVHTDADYAQARATMDALLAEVGDDETHPLAEVLDYLADHVKAYEDENFQIPEAPPGEVLAFLMEQHGIKQADLEDCAPQGRISDILSGKRASARTSPNGLRSASVSGRMFSFERAAAQAKSCRCLGALTESPRPRAAAPSSGS